MVIENDIQHTIEYFSLLGEISNQTQACDPQIWFHCNKKKLN